MSEDGRAHDASGYRQKVQTLTGKVFNDKQNSNDKILSNMTRKIIFIFAVLCSLHFQASAQSADTDTVAYAAVADDNGLLQPMQPAYLDGVITSPPWSGNWFVTLSGGASAFLGTPLGCNDLFGRIQPTYQVAAGKWFTPAIGARIGYQGMWLRDSQSAGQNYHYVHADLMWNVLGRKYGRQERVRWNLSPFLGVGLMHNATNGRNPFAFSYGVQGQYNISRRVGFVMELSGTTTFQDFDGYGKTGRLGDNMLTLTAGFSFHIGKVGWKRVVDANPYIRQNDWLIDYANSLAESNRRYASQHEKDIRTLVELKKILEIEGLLDKCSRLFENDNEKFATFPRNDYSGLNSLRARLKNRHWDGRSPLVDKSTTKSDKQRVCDKADTNSCDTSGSTEKDSNISDGGQSIDRSQSALEQSDGYGNAAETESTFTDYLSLIESGEECIGAPIYFFFALGTNRLTDASQMLNLDELARVAKKYELTISVAGAADSATGTPETNNTLSTARADFIVAELLKRGIPAERIHATSNGGIDDHTPIEANRHTRVELWLPLERDNSK